jgi:hypothetical protein
LVTIVPHPWGAFNRRRTMFADEMLIGLPASRLRLYGETRLRR